MIKHLQIKNYKSIKQLDLDCSRINVFVGRPNVGKSNILEALNLCYLSTFLLENYNTSLNNLKFGKNFEEVDLKSFFRVEEAGDLFHQTNIENPITVSSEGYMHDFKLQYYDKAFKLNAGSSLTSFNNNFEPTIETKENGMFFGSMVRPYKYKENIDFRPIEGYLDLLFPPFGDNLPNVIRYNPWIKNFVDELVKDSGVEFNIDTKTDKITIQKRVKKGLVYTLSYHSLADTIKRILFYVSAIRTNDRYVLTLEEPEVHSFPSMVSYLADEIIESDNQFFIVTHSPYLLTNLVENTPKEELGVFVCGHDKDNFQTIAKKLSAEDLSELWDYGVDIFFNINRYLDDRIEHSS